MIGIGESGLDYFYDKAPRDVQQASFRAHIRAARLAGLPLAIHARDADDDIAAILQEERDEERRFAFLLHCFSSTRALAEAALALGGYVSFSGILTFPKSQRTPGHRARLPAGSAAGGDRCALPRAGAASAASATSRPSSRTPPRCWPRCAGWSPAALAELTTANFRRLFRKAA